MKHLLFPYRQITLTNEREHFSRLYESYSGLPIPQNYLFAPSSQVFGFYEQRKLVGGFILGHARKSRTVALFAQPEQQHDVYQRMDGQPAYTEICCLWMSHSQRKKTWANSLSWLYMAWVIRRYAHSGLLFGTCSKGLAKLYRTSRKVELIHQDRINRSGTYIFTGRKQDCLVGIGNIIAAKLKKRFRKYFFMTSGWPGVFTRLKR